jgi:hypothetical protein
MTAIPYKFPNNPRIYCDRPECMALADYEMHERDLDTYKDAVPIYACAGHMPMMMERRIRQLRLVKLKVPGDPTQGGAAYGTQEAGG